MARSRFLDRASAIRFASLSVFEAAISDFLGTDLVEGLDEDFGLAFREGFEVFEEFEEFEVLLAFAASVFSLTLLSLVGVEGADEEPASLSLGDSSSTIICQRISDRILYTVQESSKKVNSVF